MKYIVFISIAALMSVGCTKRNEITQALKNYNAYKEYVTEIGLMDNYGFTLDPFDPQNEEMVESFAHGDLQEKFDRADFGYKELLRTQALNRRFTEFDSLSRSMTPEEKTKFLETTYPDLIINPQNKD